MSRQNPAWRHHGLPDLISLDRRIGFLVRALELGADLDQVRDELRRVVGPDRNLPRLVLPRDDLAAMRKLVKLDGAWLGAGVLSSRDTLAKADEWLADVAERTTSRKRSGGDTGGEAA